jgi:hypothetical protein
MRQSNALGNLEALWSNTSHLGVVVTSEFRAMRERVQYIDEGGAEAAFSSSVAAIIAGCALCANMVPESPTTAATVEPIKNGDVGRIE